MRRERPARLDRGRWAAAVLLALAVLCSGCKKQDDEKNSVTGHVSTPNGDIGGVTVDIYTATAFTSSDPWPTTEAHPQIGFTYDLPAAWDYRRASAQRVASCETGADGAFEFPDLADGDYIVEAIKAGYGWSVPQKVSVHGHSMDVGTLALAVVETLLPNVVLTGENRWLAGRHYLVQSAVTVAQGATLIIEPGVVVRFPMDSWMQVLGTLIADGEPGRFVIFTSDEALPNLGDWRYILFSETATPPRFRYCAFRWAEDPIRVSGRTGGRIESCYFASINAVGASLLGNAETQMDSIVCRGNVVNGAGVGFRVENVAVGRPMQIEHNAIYGCSKYGVELVAAFSGEVYCNWFYACGKADQASGTATGALSLIRVRDLEVDRNDFRKSVYGVDMGSLVDSSVHIRNNYFYLLSRGMNVGWTPESAGPSFPHFNYNCIQAVEYYYIYVDDCLINTQPLDATNNYWDGRSEASVRQHFLYDHDDDPTCPRVTIGTILPSCNREEAGICAP
jgi:hypothetical protein